MPINTLAYAQIFQKELDKEATAAALTGWMEGNSGQVKYNGGNEVKIPKMSLSGLGDYDRDNGYAQGSVTLAYETRSMTQDRGRGFQLDAMDVDETNFVATAGAVMGAFQRMHVVPEIAAYRLSKLATEAITKNTAATTGLVETGYTPAAATALAKLKGAIAKIRDYGFSGQLVCHMTSEFKVQLELALAAQLRDITWNRNGIDTQVPALDGVPLIETPQNRMYTAITLYDGVTEGGSGAADQRPGGYVKGSSAKDINFIVMAQSTPIAVSKQDIMRIFDPQTYQKANAWYMDYRRYHDMWVKDNQILSIAVNTKS
jgi:hypothetical protein